MKPLIALPLFALILASACVAPGYGPPAAAPAPETPAAPAAPVTTPTGEVREIAISGTEFSLSPATITVNAGETVRITFTNTGTTIHNFGISALGVRTRTIGPGASDTIEFVASQSGTFDFDCSVGNHAALGMVGQLTVS